jgi:ABC-type nitrate/sulfonate/bicarbonate transport system permease component
MIGDGTIAPHLASTVSRIVMGLLGGATADSSSALPWACRGGCGVVDPIVAALHPDSEAGVLPAPHRLFGVGEMSKLAAVSLGRFPNAVEHRCRRPRDESCPPGAGTQLPGHTTADVPPVLLPGSLPLMLTGLRLSSNVAFHATIGVEMVRSRTGIGSLLWLSWQTFVSTVCTQLWWSSPLSESGSPR